MRSNLAAFVTSVLAVSCMFTIRAQEAPPAPIRILALVDEALADVRSGIDLGVEEMGRTATLLGRGLEVTWVTGDAVRPIASLAEDPRFGSVLAAVTAGMPGALAGTRSPGMAVFELSAEPGAAARHHGAWFFHVRTDPPGREWKSDLDRFGAGELNERYERRAGRGMTADAWVGWVAVKAIVEAALRADARDRTALAEALRTLRFDAHKGEPLSFDRTQRLVQPEH